MSNFLANNKVDQIAGYTAAGVTAVKSDIVDMAGYEEASFIFHFDTLIAGSVLNCYINGNTTNATGGTKLAGAIAYTVTSADAALGQSAIAISVYQADPALYRYLEAVVDPDTQNAVLTGVTCIRSGGKYKPEPNTGLLAKAILVSPIAA